MLKQDGTSGLVTADLLRCLATSNLPNCTPEACWSACLVGRLDDANMPLTHHRFCVTSHTNTGDLHENSFSLSCQVPSSRLPFRSGRSLLIASQRRSSLFSGQPITFEQEQCLCTGSIVSQGLIVLEEMGEDVDGLFLQFHTRCSIGLCVRNKQLHP